MSDDLEWSHGKRRPKSPRLLGNDTGVAPLPSSDDAEPIKDAQTGRFLPGNTAYRRRVLKGKANGITTLAPSACAAWLRPHVADGAAYGMDLLRRFPDPTLARLVGHVADAHAVYRGLLALAAMGDTDALREARAWAVEHRTALATLSGLAGETTAQPSDAHLFVDTKAGVAK